MKVTPVQKQPGVGPRTPALRLPFLLRARLPEGSFCALFPRGVSGWLGLFLAEHPEGTAGAASSHAYPGGRSNELM